MSRMFELYKSGFNIEDNKALNEFALEIINISEEYIRYLVYKGKINSLGDLSSYDAAVDLTAELFTIENGCLSHFKKFFSGFETPPETEEDVNRLIRQFVYVSTMNNVSLLYKFADPVTNKLLRNLNYARKSGDYLQTEIFTNKYIHRKEVDFESAVCMEREKLARLIGQKRGIGFLPATEFLEEVFKILEEQTEYLHAVPFSDLLQIYKELSAKEIRKDFESMESGSESNIYMKLLVEEIRKSYLLKLKNYITKKNFSKNESDCIYNIVEEVINCYLSGTERESVKELAKRYYNGTVTNSLCYKIDYAIDLLNSEIISFFKREEEENVKKLSK